MDEVQWIKLYIDMFDKRKINKIRRLPAGNDILLFWVMLLATAGKCNAGGMIYITERVPFTKEDLADEFDFELSTIELALKAFVEFDMIDLYEDGFISVKNWEYYQNSDKLAEIRAKDRERKRLKKAQTKGELPSSTEIPRKFHGNSTDVPHIEEEKEEDKEKEYHSFIHSNVREEENSFKGVENSDIVWEEVSDPDGMGASPALKVWAKGSLGDGYLVMSDIQFHDLLDKLSMDELHRYIDIVVECEKNGKHYKKKSHYQAILDMVKKDRRIAKKG